MLKSIERLKQNFLLKKLNKTITKNADLFLKLNSILNTKFNPDLFFIDSEIERENFESEQFDLLQNILCEKSNIKIIYDILTLYYRIIKISEYQILPKEFLSAWMISRFPKYIFQTGITPENIRIKLYSNKLIGHIKSILENNTINTVNTINNFARFNLDLIQYKIAFDIFMKIDKINKIDSYSAEWIQLEIAKNEINSSNKYLENEKNQIISYIEKDKAIIEKHMRILQSNFDYNKLKLFIKLSEYSKNKIIENYKQILQKELDNDKFDIFEKILNEIKQFLIIFNKNKEIELNEYIDIGYIKHLILTKIITIDDINILSTYIINNLVKLASITTEKELLNKWEVIKANNLNNLNQYIANILIYLMDIVKIIKQEIDSYGTLLKLNI